MTTLPIKIGAISSVLATGILLAGCGGDSAEPAPTVTVTSTVTVAADPPASDRTVGTDVSQAEDAAATAEPGTLDPSNTGDRELTLSDAARTDPEGDWRTDRFNIAEESDIRGNAVDLYCYSEPTELEFRLENKFTELTFAVGQANSSDSSDNEIKLEVLGDGDQIDVKNIAFNKVESFTIDVTGVNALRLGTAIDDEDSECFGDTTAVLFDMRLS